MYRTVNDTPERDDAQHGQQRVDEHSSHDGSHDGGSEPRVTIEMGGPNIVIRSMADIDLPYTSTLADAVNVANDSGMVVVIDPETIRCDEAFASSALPLSEIQCADHADCRSVAVEAVERGVIRIAAEHTSWMVDIGRGRFCQIDTPIDPMFLHPDTWTSVVALYVTPTKLSALTEDGTLVSSRRAHRPAVVDPPAA